ncbi:MAG: hypothetical protein KF901_07320 [Myxococcales bacterium]|nr:hypothetical protein [Myxococcales bacterium]
MSGRPLMRANPPLDRWPEQLHDPRFGFAWFTAPAVFVNQLADAHATLKTVHALHDAIDHVIERRAREIEAEGASSSSTIGAASAATTRRPARLTLSG